MPGNGLANYDSGGSPKTLLVAIAMALLRSAESVSESSIEAHVDGGYLYVDMPVAACQAMDIDINLYGGLASVRVCCWPKFDLIANE